MNEKKEKRWAQRLNQARNTQRASRTELLPLPRPISDVLSLEYHLQLEALRIGVGTLLGLRVLMKVAVATSLLGERGFGAPTASLLESFEESATRAFADGKEGSYKFDADAFRLFAQLVTDHDAQLKVVPLRVIDSVANLMEAHRK